MFSGTVQSSSNSKLVTSSSNYGTSLTPIASTSATHSLSQIALKTGAIAAVLLASATPVQSDQSLESIAKIEASKHNPDKHHLMVLKELLCEKSLQVFSTCPKGVDVNCTISDQSLRNLKQRIEDRYDSSFKDLYDYSYLADKINSKMPHCEEVLESEKFPTLRAIGDSLNTTKSIRETSQLIKSKQIEEQTESKHSIYFIVATVLNCVGIAASFLVGKKNPEALKALDLTKKALSANKESKVYGSTTSTDL